MERDIRAEREALDREIEGMTLCSVFAERVRELGENPALFTRDAGGPWHATSWIEYRARVREVALGVAALGFSRGDFAVILGHNRAEHVIADLGTVHAGGTAVSLYTTLSPEQIAYIAGHTEARVAFV